MKFALVGHGKMGRAIEAAAAARGHRRVVTVDPSGRGKGRARTVGAAAWRGVDVAFEFTTPESARDNVVALLERGLAVICGTTGWDPADRAVTTALRSSRGALLVAPNFSLGMALFTRSVASAAAAFAAAGGYDPWILETHHRAKRDAPSGTARALARVVAGARAPAAAVAIGTGDAAIGPGDVHVVSIRAGHEPGRHTVGFAGPYDAVTLTHEARSREGFALGAVLAAEWLVGRRGRRELDDVVDDLMGKASRRGGRGGRR